MRPIVDDDDAIGELDEAGAMRDDDRSSCARILADALLNWCSVEKSMALVGSSGRTNGSMSTARAIATSCRWPPRQRFAALADQHVETLRMAIDELGQPGHLGRLDDRGVVGIRRADTDVLAQRAIKEDAPARQSRCCADVGRIELALVDAVEADGALGRLVESGGASAASFAGTGAPDDDDLLRQRMRNDTFLSADSAWPG